MSNLSTEKQQQVLKLIGELDANSLNDLWRQQVDLMAGIKIINVAGLKRVDSPGLATIVYFCNKYQLNLTGINRQLTTLITLYDLQHVIDIV